MGHTVMVETPGRLIENIKFLRFTTERKMEDKEKCTAARYKSAC